MELTIVNGSPGIGCPVIASTIGAALAVMVTEPTVSGLHDLGRVAELLRHFAIPGLVCINRAVTRAQTAGKAVVEHEPGVCARDIVSVWATVRKHLAGTGAFRLALS